MVLQQVEAERHRKYQTSPSQASETRFGAATSLIWPDLVLRLMLMLVPWYQAANWYQVAHCPIPGSTKTQFWRYQLCLRCHSRNLAHALKSGRSKSGTACRIDPHLSLPPAPPAPTPRPGYSTSTARCLMTCTCLVRGFLFRSLVAYFGPPLVSSGQGRWFLM